MVNSHHTQANRERIIATQQTSGRSPLSAAAEKRNAETLALAMQIMQAEKLAAAMPCADLMIDGFNLIADMTPEMEQVLNDLIERGEK